MIYRKVGEYSYHTIFSHFILMQFRLKKTEEIREGTEKGILLRFNPNL